MFNFLYTMVQEIMTCGNQDWSDVQTEIVISEWRSFKFLLSSDGSSNKCFHHWIFKRSSPDKITHADHDAKQT
jgi:hypothetical protein